MIIPSYIAGVIAGLAALPVWEFLKRIKPKKEKNLPKITWIIQLKDGMIMPMPTIKNTIPNPMQSINLFGMVLLRKPPKDLWNPNILSKNGSAHIGIKRG